MEIKSIEAIISPGQPHYVGDGFRVHNYIPGRFSMQRMSPFIMMDYNSKFYFPPSEKPKGVGVHPHRGFETVTIAYKGKIAHEDSTGNKGIIEEGGVQWMTAASGILHKEYHEESFSKTGGDFQMVQLWVNLPAKDKMSTPKYQAIAHHEISKYYLPDQGGKVEIIAGAHRGIAGAASTFTEVNLLNVYLNAEQSESFSFPANFTTAVLVLEGSVLINDTSTLVSDQFALFKNDGTDFNIKATAQSIVLVLSGAPILEPIVSHGPFVMNSREEIMEAFEDFNAGKFGYLE